MTAVAYVTKVATAWVMAAVKWFQNLILHQKAWKMWKNREMFLRMTTSVLKKPWKKSSDYCPARLKCVSLMTGIISHGFSDKLIDKIVSNVNFIYNVHDVI